MKYLAIFLAASSLFAQPQCSLEVIAGLGGPLPDSGGPAVEAELLAPSDARIGSDGLLYIADPAQHVIWRVLADQTIEIFAGTGESGSSGNGGPARAAKLDEPRQLAFGPDGSVYVLATGERHIRRISPDGVIHAFAGDGKGIGSQNLYQPGMTAAELPLGPDTDIAAGAEGQLYATLPSQHRVVRIDQDGTVTPFAGRSATWSEYGVTGDGGPATEALLESPADIAVDAAGNLYIADPNNDRIRRVRTDGVIETFAGPSQMNFARLTTLESDFSGRVYFSSSNQLRRLDEDGQPEPYWPGTGDSFPSFSIGADGAVYSPRGLQVVRGNPVDGTFATVAGLGSSGRFGEGGQALQARFRDISGIAVGSEGEIYVADSSLHRVRVIRPGGVLERFAGTGTDGFGGDNGPALQAMFNRPGGLAVDAEGRVWIADSINSRIRRVDAAGIVSTVAGNGAPFCGSQSNACGDGGPAIDAAVPRPRRVVPAAEGGVWVIDDNSLRRPRIWLRRISPDGTIDAVAPLFVNGSLDPAAAAAAAARPDGALLVYTRDERSNELVASLDGVSSAQVEPELTAYLPYSTSMVFGPDGALYAAEGVSIRRAIPGSQSSTLATVKGVLADAQAPIVVDEEFRVADLAVGPDGDLYFTDSFLQRVYRLHQPSACALPQRPEVAIQGVRHGASFEGSAVRFVSPFVAPGQILAIFGRRLGPAELAGPQIVNGKLTTSIGGVRVLIDGRPTPMIFSSAGQVGAIVPYATAVTDLIESKLQVEVDGVLSEPVGLRVVHAQPGIFTLDSSGTGPGAILNQNASLNSANNPANPGETIALWATGEGQTNPPGVDGLIAAGPLPKPVLGVTARVGGQPATVAYAGAAPGLAAGAMQVNIRLPATLTTAGAVPVSIQVGEHDSGAEQRVTVFVAP